MFVRAIAVAVYKCDHPKCHYIACNDDANDVCFFFSFSLSLGASSSLQRRKPNSNDSTAKFWFATGGAGFCISRALSLRMLPVAGNGKLIGICDRIRFPDDVTVGFVIGGCTIFFFLLFTLHIRHDMSCQTISTLVYCLIEYEKSNHILVCTEFLYLFLHLFVHRKYFERFVDGRRSIPFAFGANGEHTAEFIPGSGKYTISHFIHIQTCAWELYY